MRLLRVLMTVFTLVGLGLLVSFPWFVGVKPAGSEGQVAYVTRFAAYIVLVSVSFLFAAVFAVLLARKIREEYRQQTLKNLADLLTNFPSPRKGEDAPDNSR
ncbi:MAG: hypothetical protein K6T17_09825 [Fimbriimonadales bacterium]|nr:hypothetical protein [Fimbriimonadales bacterium]